MLLLECRAALHQSEDIAADCGLYEQGQGDLPAMVAERTYAQVAAEGDRAAALHSDTAAVANGLSDEDQRGLPAVATHLTYTQCRRIFIWQLSLAG